jgi:hypothetical protein
MLLAQAVTCTPSTSQNVRGDGKQPHKNTDSLSDSQMVHATRTSSSTKTMLLHLVIIRLLTLPTICISVERLIPSPADRPQMPGGAWRIGTRDDGGTQCVRA